MKGYELVRSPYGYWLYLCAASKQRLPPRFTYRPILNRNAYIFDSVQGDFDVVNFDRQIWNRCSRSSISGKTYLDKYYGKKEAEQIYGNLIDNIVSKCINEMVNDVKSNVQNDLPQEIHHESSTTTCGVEISVSEMLSNYLAQISEPIS
jgi:hypothetical protein